MSQFQVKDLIAFLGQLAPLELAAQWDNVGLLLGDPEKSVARVLTCLTLTPNVAEEALQECADLVVTHHPLPFRPISRIVATDPVGRILLTLASREIAVYSPHTAWDSALAGINQQIAEGLGLEGTSPLVGTTPDGLGAGRYGDLLEAIPVSELVDRAKKFFGVAQVGLVGETGARIRRVAIACGSAAELIPAAIATKCDIMITGELSYHRCLEAAFSGLPVILVGHFASEKFAMAKLADRIRAEFPGLAVWSSRSERDPVEWV
jgi:dinuclear metal center YbgI/SA1388 family protein